MMKTPENTARLQFNPITKRDASFLYEMMNDEAFIEHIGDRNIRTVHDAEDYIELIHLDSYKKFNFGFYLVQLLDGTPIGTCGYIDRKGIDGIEIGYAFTPNYRGIGLAFEAVENVLSFGLNTLNFSNLVAIVNETNQKSINLLEKIGFSYAQKILFPDTQEEVLYFKFTEN